MNLFWTHLRVFFYMCVENTKVAFRYYRKGRFFLTDRLIVSHFVWRNPYKIAKGYGITPLTTLDHIACECRLLSKDIVYDLGCGTGRTVFWLASFIGCQAIGIDRVDTFIDHASKVKNTLHVHNAAFLKEDFLKADLSQATAIYLYGTTLDETAIQALIQRFLTLKPGTKIITVSYPLTDYSDQFEVKKQFKGSFPWGMADIYLNELLI